MRTTLCFTLALLLLCAAPAPVLAYDDERTIDTLTAQEVAELDRLEGNYFKEMRTEGLKLLTSKLDMHSILRSFPEQLRILQQRKRKQYQDVERYLYSLRLNPEFIDSYMRNLKDDSINYAMDTIIQRAKGMRSRH